MTVLLALAVVGTLLFLSYWIPTRVGFSRTGIALSTILAAGISIMTICIVFEDQLFSKRDAASLLKQQDIVLNDNFIILKNQSMWAPGDYYHTFTLKISESDKSRISTLIRSAANFQDKEIPSSLITQVTNQYNAGKLTQNYETKDDLVCELFESHGEGYAPTYGIIQINKAEGKLVFKDIDE
ncbi:hypothetical protein [uncultured Hymenobacter sp.]|uniref:hypothetical protein n=1 Tax=uncultured Hymenobacter sp. TaxID=170016 RepID=UPI0035C9EBA3